MKTCVRCGFEAELAGPFVRRFGWHLTGAPPADFVRTGKVTVPILDKFDMCRPCLDALSAPPKPAKLFLTKAEARRDYRAAKRF